MFRVMSFQVTKTMSDRTKNMPTLKAIPWAVSPTGFPLS
jgi:hypothetical protein